MTTAVASNINNAAAAVPYGWLSPRVSFSRDAAADDEPAVSSSSSSHVLGAVAVSTRVTPEPAISKDFIDFEFSLGGSATMLSADELFADGKLLPLRKAAPSPDPETALPAPAQVEAGATMLAQADQPVKPSRAAAVIAADGTDPYAFSPRAPSCSSRWRELLGLKRAAAQSPSPKPSPSAPPTAKTPARAMNSAAARSLKLLLQRNNGRSSGAAASSDLSSAPLLRDSSDSEASLSLASSRFSLSSSSSSSGGHDHDDIPRLSLDSADPNPPRIRLVPSSQHRHSTSSSTRGPARRGPSPPPPPRRCPSGDSPRMNLFGKIVFHSLERSSSSPCSLHAASSRSRSTTRAVDRSYSSGVRVAPVVLNVNVPVCGFFKDRKDSNSAAKESSAAARSRSSLGRKTQTPPQHGWSAELPRSSG